MILSLKVVKFSSNCNIQFNVTEHLSLSHNYMEKWPDILDWQDFGFSFESRYNETWSHTKLSKKDVWEII